MDEMGDSAGRSKSNPSKGIYRASQDERIEFMPRRIDPDEWPSELSQREQRRASLSAGLTRFVALFVAATAAQLGGAWWILVAVALGVASFVF